MAHRIGIVGLALLAVSCAAFAGGSIFSGNGIGEPLHTGGVRVAGLAGAGIGLADSLSFHTGNPALAAYAPRMSFRMSGQFGWWSTSSAGRSDADAEFVWRDFHAYFPVTPRWRIGFGAEPVRRMDLATFTDKTAIFDDTSTVHYEQRDIWQGSTLELRLDNAFKLGNHLALGISPVYVMLHTSQVHTLDMDQLIPGSYYGDASYRTTETFRGWTGDLGVHWQATSRAGIGLVLRPRSSGDWTRKLEKAGSDSIEKFDRSGNQPGFIKIGLSYLLKPRLIAVADFSAEQWKAEDLNPWAASRGVKPTSPLSIELGCERLAGRSAVRGGFYNWAVRGGLFYRRQYWPERNGSSVEDVGVSIGLSAPMSGQLSYFHWAAEVGRRGLNEDNLGATETFFRTSLQIDITEQWFERSKPRTPK